MNYLSIASVLFLATLAAGQTPVPTLMPTIEVPTIPVGTNPQVTAKPDTQKGTLGPTTQVFTQQFGDTFVPAPTAAPEETSAPSGACARPPVAVTLTGAAAAVALL